MNETLKKILKVSLVLGSISAVSAGVIGLANAVTAPKIKENASKKEMDALPMIYGGEVKDYSEVTYDSADAQGNAIKVSVNEKYKVTYTQKQWVFNGEGAANGSFVFKCYGKNGYGDVTMVIGITKAGALCTIYMIEDTESYKNILEPNYVDVYNRGCDKEADIENVKCGATYGATMIRDMAREAQSVVQGKATARPLPGVAPEAVKNFFNTADKKYVFTEMSSEFSDDFKKNYAAVTEAYQVKDGESTIGYVIGTTSEYKYLGSTTAEMVMYTAIDGIGADAKIKGVYVDSQESAYLNKVVEGVNGYDFSKNSIDDFTISGATYSAEHIREMAKLSLSAVKDGGLK